MATLFEAFKFFREHAGYSTPPGRASRATFAGPSDAAAVAS